MFITSPNMNLPIPSVGSELGPAYAFDVNAALTLVDFHDHTPGHGVAITPAGMDINVDLTFGGFAAINLRAAVFNPQTSVSENSAIYVNGVDFYLNDGNGNIIRLTQSGAIVGTPGSITGLPSGTAGVNFSGGTYTFSESTNTPGNIQCGSISLGNNTALSKYMTINPPNAMASNFSINFPTLPGSTQIMQLDSSGNISALLTVDNVTIQISSNLLSVKNDSIGTAQLATGIGFNKSQTITSSGSFIVPAGVNSITVFAIGGGGGGGGGADIHGGSGGGGGAGSIPSLTVINVTPGETLTITIGGGGSGAAPNSGGAGPTGNAGGSTKITRISTDLFVVSGGAGGQSGFNTTGGNGGAGFFTINGSSTSGGNGGAGGSSTNGNAGQSSVLYARNGGTGGLANQGGGSGSGGGGGGGAGWGGDGGPGAGGSSGSPGSNGGGYGAGAGGGGGASNTGSSPSSGGTGSSGVVIISWAST